MRLALFGSPGSGKGTQAAFLKKRYGLQHLSTGNMLRAARDAGTALGLEAGRYMEDGQLVPDDVVWEVARKALTACGFDDFILDGFPRTLRQARWLDEDIDRLGVEFKVIDLEVPDEVIIDRLSKRRMHKVTGETYQLDYNPPPADVDPSDLVQRADDHPRAIEQRLSVYHDETEPLKRYYDGRGSLFEVDGVGDVETVAERVAAALEP